MSKELLVESPCISVCAMDEVSGFCLGCYRTLEEIQNWWDLDNAQRSAIVEQANQRAASMFED
jgi:predicted Fe-S protein YdhL (DUF1289 family)